MKKMALALLCLLATLTFVSAQNDSTTQTLFSGIGKPRLGVFVSPAYQIGQMDGATAHLLALRGGVVLNNRLSLGVAFQSSVNEILPESETDNRLYMDYRTWGGLVEYTWRANRLVHLTFPVVIGAGEVEMDWRDAYDRDWDSAEDEAYFGFVEPSALVEINLFRYVRLNAGVGYRFIGDLTYRNLNQGDLAGFTGTIGLKFGLFR